MCTNVENQKRFGSVKIDENNKIRAFGIKDASKFILVNAGIYKLERSIFSLIEKNVFDLEKSLFPICSEIGLLNCFSLNIDFEDIGIPEAYYRELKQHEKGSLMLKNNLNIYLCDHDVNLKEALLKNRENAKGILFVVNKDVLIGVITDGTFVDYY